MSVRHDQDTVLWNVQHVMVASILKTGVWCSTSHSALPHKELAIIVFH